MNFDIFLNKINQLKAFETNARFSHQKMEPEERKNFMKDIDFDLVKPKNASVMILIYPKNNKATFVLILRASFGVHSSQIGFPGGKYEDSDKDFSETALRETEEEIGIDRNLIQNIRDFTPTYIPPSNFMVHPFLGYMTQKPIFKIQEAEVSGIIEVDVTEFLDDKRVISKKIKTSYMNEVDVTGFDIEGHFVWGATAMILSEFKDCLKEVISNYN